MEYVIRRAQVKPELQGLWDGAAWKVANIARIEKFLKESSDHRPMTEAKAVYDEGGIYVIFRVQDRYVVCTRTEHQELTSKDSCVEVYLEPPATEAAKAAMVDRGPMTT